MITVKGIYDGKNVNSWEDLPTGKKYNELITLLVVIEEVEQVRYAFYNPDSFSFFG
jgi:hypothetical protein